MREQRDCQLSHMPSPNRSSYISCGCLWKTSSGQPEPQYHLIQVGKSGEATAVVRAQNLRGSATDEFQLLHFVVGGVTLELLDTVGANLAAFEDRCISGCPDATSILDGERCNY